MQIQNVGQLHQAERITLASRATLIAITLTALAAALRIFNITANGMSLDEAYTLWMVLHTPDEIIQMILARGVDANPPLFYLLTHFMNQPTADLLSLRAVSLLAGCAMVWLTFQWGLHMFDVRVASLAGLLMALSPLQLEGARIARAPMLAALWSVASLYLFTRIVYRSASRRHWVGFVLASALAFYTHYITFLVHLFQCLVVLTLLLRRRLTRQQVGQWFAAYTAIGLLVLPLLFPIVSHAGLGSGQNWLGRPGIATLIKAAIFFLTGDPSYGSIRVTIERAIASGVIALVAGLVAWIIIRWRQHNVSAPELGRALYLASAFLVPWLVAWTISQARPIYHHKYLLFVMAPMFILVSWALTRTRPVLLARLTLLALLLVTARAVFVFHTEPNDEQWREAVAYVAPQYRPDDIVIVSPGYNLRPFAYYFQGYFPADVQHFSPEPAAVLHNGQYAPLAFHIDGQQVLSDDPVLTQAARIWLVTGEIPENQPLDDMLVAWLRQSFPQSAGAEFVGVRVHLLQPAAAQR